MVGKALTAGYLLWIGEETPWTSLLLRTADGLGPQVACLAAAWQRMLTDTGLLGEPSLE